jgi:hypothetical protein
LAAAEEGDGEGVELVACEVVEPGVQERLEFGDDRDRASAGAGFAVADGDRFVSGCDVEVGEREAGRFADTEAAPAQ